MKIGTRTIKNVCIVGAGNIGHYLMALIGHNDWLSVNVLTSHVDGFSDAIESVDVTTGTSTVGRITKVSANPVDVIPESDIIIFAVPSNAYAHYAEIVYPYVSEGVILGFIPGSGGPEFVFADFVQKKRCKIFGTQRVPSGTKVVERGVRVHSLGNRKDSRVAAIPQEITEDVCCFLTAAIGINTMPLKNYLAVTLTPSNPIVHTCRLYGLFHDYESGRSWPEKLHLYSTWDDLSSAMLLGCDDELTLLRKEMVDISLEGLLSLREHYEVGRNAGDAKADISRLTAKMRSLPFLKDFAPMALNKGGRYIPDLSTRYFTEDFPFGLCIIKSFCEICRVTTPFIDKVLSWYEKLMSVSYSADGRFVGKDLRDLPLPQNQGLLTTDAIVKFYSR